MASQLAREKEQLAEQFQFLYEIYCNDLDVCTQTRMIGKEIPEGILAVLNNYSTLDSDWIEFFSLFTFHQIVNFSHTRWTLFG